MPSVSSNASHSNHSTETFRTDLKKGRDSGACANTVIQSYVHRNYLSICPFHSEQHSFQIGGLFIPNFNIKFGVYAHEPLLCIAAYIKHAVNHAGTCV